MIDRIGVEVNIGDKVAYSKTERGDTELYTGIVQKIDDTYCTIKADDSGRKIDRWYRCIISLEPSKVTNPELFI